MLKTSLKFYGICPRPGHRCQIFGRLKFFEHYSVSVSRLEILEFLSITVFRGLNLTEHCHAQKNQLFTASKLTKLVHSSVSWPEPHKTL